MYGLIHNAIYMTEQHSPYAAPKAQIDTPDERPEDDFIIAGKWLRFANYMIDMAAMILLSFLFFVVIDYLANEELVNEELLDQALAIGDSIFFDALLMLIYYLPPELLFARTPAKWITGTKVVDEDGLKPSTGKIIGRTFSRIIPFEPFSFLGQTGRGWHDSFSGTYVIKAR